MSAAIPQICLVDDDASVRGGLTRLLRSAGYHVTTFPSADAFLADLSGLDIDCLLLDVRMQGMDGMELHQHLATIQFRVPIVFLTGHGDIPMSVQAMKRGARDFLTKPVDEEILLETLERALEAGRERATIQARIDRLTPREFEVMRCLLAGALNKQVAAHLGIVEKTVKVHRARIFEKIGTHSLAELARLCDHAGIEPSDCP